MKINSITLLPRIGRSVSHLPAMIRSRLRDNTLIRNVRAAWREEAEPPPYVLLQEAHIAHLQVVLNRNALLSCLPKQAVVAEIGVSRGDFSQRILNFAQPRELYLIDLWNSDRYHEGLMEVVQRRFEPQLHTGCLHIHRGYSLDVLATFPDHFFDWVYLDTDHTYATTARELLLLQRKVKTGGIIAGHDYVTGDWKLRLRYGVVEAVNEFCVRHDWEMVYMTNETHRHLSFALRAITP